MLNPVILLKGFWRAWKTAELQQKFSLMRVILYLDSWRIANIHTLLGFVICIIRNTSFDVVFKEASVNIHRCVLHVQGDTHKWHTLLKHTVHLQRILFSLQWISFIGMKEGSVLNPENFSLSTSGWCGSYWLSFISILDYMVEMLKLFAEIGWIQFKCTLTVFIKVSDSSVDGGTLDLPLEWKRIC